MREGKCVLPAARVISRSAQPRHTHTCLCQEDTGTYLPTYPRRKVALHKMAASDGYNSSESRCVSRNGMSWGRFLRTWGKPLTERKEASKQSVKFTIRNRAQCHAPCQDVTFGGSVGLKGFHSMAWAGRLPLVCLCFGNVCCCRVGCCSQTTRSINKAKVPGKSELKHCGIAFPSKCF